MNASERHASPTILGESMTARDEFVLLLGEFAAGERGAVAF